MIDADAVKLVVMHKKLKTLLKARELEYNKSIAKYVEQLGIIEKALDETLMGMVNSGVTPKFSVEGVGVCRLTFENKSYIKDSSLVKAHVLNKGLEGFDYVNLTASKTTIGEIERNGVVQVVPLIPGVDVKRSRKVRITKR